MTVKRKIALLFSLLILSLNISAMSNPPENIEPVSVTTISEGNNMFAFELYSKLKNRSGNLFFSPYSISTALAMTYAGAVENTEREMAATLNFSLDQEMFHKEFAQLQQNLNEADKAAMASFNIANSLWLQHDYKFLDSYLKRTKDNYDSEFNYLDFKQTEKARLNINAWAAKKTRGKIKNLIKPGMLSPMNKLVLTNAIYFKGIWQKTFNERDTRLRPFFLADGTTRKIPMMYQTEKISYLQDPSLNLQAVELPYSGNRLSMLVLLPVDKNGIDKLETELNEKTIPRITENLKPEKIKLYLPKFKMTEEFLLEKTLASMGMPESFSPRADFSAMTGNKDFHIGRVIHKAFVDVYEEGTEAAAATAVTMKMTSIQPNRTPVFKADHPFIFMIRDNITKSILFIGRLAEPEGK